MGILKIFDSLYGDALGELRIVMAAIPVIEDALGGGPAAFEAFMKASPKTGAHLQDLADALKQEHEQNAAPQPATLPQVAAVAAHIAGVDPPGWTDAETQRWFDREDES